MRELKFRAWDGKQIRYDVTGLEHGSLNEMRGVFIDGDYYTISESADRQHGDIANRAVVMQFTGLFDKNGVEIYEGDIVSGVLYKDYSEHVGRILFDFNGYMIVTKNKSMPLDLPEKLTVIGNIHQHPELLK